MPSDGSLKTSCYDEDVYYDDGADDGGDDYDGDDHDDDDDDHDDEDDVGVLGLVRVIVTMTMIKVIMMMRARFVIFSK